VKKHSSKVGYSAANGKNLSLGIDWTWQTWVSQGARYRSSYQVRICSAECGPEGFPSGATKYLGSFLFCIFWIWISCGGRRTVGLDKVLIQKSWSAFAVFFKQGPAWLWGAPRAWLVIGLSFARAGPPRPPSIFGVAMFWQKSRVAERFFQNFFLMKGDASGRAPESSLKRHLLSRRLPAGRDAYSSRA
jgi:hypothetical protein